MDTSKDLLKLTGNDNMLLVMGHKKKKPESLKTFQVPPSSVLQQARAFLPQLASANAALEERLRTTPASQLDIENIDNCQGDIIEMNLAVVENGDSDSCDSSSGEDSEDEDDDQPMFPEHLTPDNIHIKKPVPRTKRPNIEIMTDLQTSADVSKTGAKDTETEESHTTNSARDSEKLTHDIDHGDSHSQSKHSEHC